MTGIEEHEDHCYSVLVVHSNPSDGKLNRVGESRSSPRYDREMRNGNTKTHVLVVLKELDVQQRSTNLLRRHNNSKLLPIIFCEVTLLEVGLNIAIRTNPDTFIFEMADSPEEIKAKPSLPIKRVLAFSI